MTAKIPLYQVDAFTNQLFGGNPAAVCVMSEWLEESIMQKIASENNLAETAFVVLSEGIHGIRWFTPEVEVDLCGHATLAAGYVLFQFYNQAGDTIHFQSRKSGILKVTRKGDKLILDFPADSIQKTDELSEYIETLKIKPIETWKGKTDFMLVFNKQDEIESFVPDMNSIKKIEARGIIITAPGQDTDFVSRFFAPQSGVAEDPVTGSAHTTLTPYWSEKLKRNELTARQLSIRKGDLVCKQLGERVEISGQAKLYLVGEILIKSVRL